MPKNTNYKKPDFILLGVTLAILTFGILVLSSVSASISLDKFGNTYHYLNHQIFYGIIPGVLLGFVAYRIDLNFIKKWVWVALLINLILLAMVFLPKIGTTLGGASRWLNFRIFSLQPSEFLKLTFIIYLAAWLSAQHEKISQKKSPKDFSKTLIAFLAVVGVIGILLFFQPDISTLGVIATVAAIMYFLSGTPVLHTIFLILFGIGILFLAIKIAPYRANRLLVFLKPETSPMGLGYQAKQALITIGSGGIFGLGLGISRQQFGFLPEPMSDSIFAILAEETGFIGAAIFILLFLTFLVQGFKIGKSGQNQFSQLLAFGITSWILIQAVINIGSMVGLLPLAGVPLPFISYGGSALVSELIGVGILLNISKSS
ncbi:MAG: putative lipid II flippase FtsW [Candidatus Pacebacteria bacterium]|nr:putative lipid II flippase FtsW [Candidatus Paceibacterota bacterium]